MELPCPILFSSFSQAVRALFEKPGLRNKVEDEVWLIKKEEHGDVNSQAPREEEGQLSSLKNHWGEIKHY